MILEEKQKDATLIVLIVQVVQLILINMILQLKRRQMNKFKKN